MADFIKQITVGATTYDINAAQATSAVQATKDANGNVITNTYATKTELASAVIDGGTW